jgi:hypothetical protein
VAKLRRRGAFETVLSEWIEAIDKVEMRKEVGKSVHSQRLL